MPSLHSLTETYNKLKNINVDALRDMVMNLPSVFSEAGNVLDGFASSQHNLPKEYRAQYHMICRQLALYHIYFSGNKERAETYAYQLRDNEGHVLRALAKLLDPTCKDFKLVDFLDGNSSRMSGYAIALIMNRTGEHKGAMVILKLMMHLQVSNIETEACQRLYASLEREVIDIGLTHFHVPQLTAADAASPASKAAPPRFS